MKALFIDPQGNEAKVVNPGSLEDYYELIGCNLIDIVTRKIGRKYYDVICDDEGLLQDDPLISAIDDIGRVMFVGKLIVCGLVNDEGENTDLTARDIKYIKDRVQPMYTRQHMEGLLMLTNCNY